MKNRTKEGKEAREAFAFSRLFRSALIGIGIMIAVALLTMLCSSAIAYSMADPAAFTFPFGIASLYISIFAGGFLPLGQQRKEPSWISFQDGSFCFILYSWN